MRHEWRVPQQEWGLLNIIEKGLDWLHGFSSDCQSAITIAVCHPVTIGQLLVPVTASRWLRDRHTFGESGILPMTFPMLARLKTTITSRRKNSWQRLPVTNQMLGLSTKSIEFFLIHLR